jgi:hypothetical protein
MKTSWSKTKLVCHPSPPPKGHLILTHFAPTAREYEDEICLNSKEQHVTLHTSQRFGFPAHLSPEIVEVDDSALVRGVHDEGRLLHSVMTHQQDEVSVMHAGMDVVTVADGRCSHVVGATCSMPRV